VEKLWAYIITNVQNAGSILIRKIERTISVKLVEPNITKNITKKEKRSDYI